MGSVPTPHFYGAVVSAIFATLVTLNLATPGLLLFFMLLIGIFGALEAPAWQSLVPQLVPKQALAPKQESESNRGRHS